jgi:hypothetical protein
MKILPPYVTKMLCCAIKNVTNWSRTRAGLPDRA